MPKVRNLFNTPSRIVAAAAVAALVIGGGIGLADAASTSTTTTGSCTLNEPGGATLSFACTSSYPSSGGGTTTTTTTPSGGGTTTTTVPPTTTTTAAPTTTTTAPSAGGNCTNPTWQSNGTVPWSVNTDPGPVENWWVNTDAWNGSHGPQSMFVCNQSSWYVTSNQPNDGGAVETYPNTEYDIGGRDNPSTKTIGQLNSITSTFSEAMPAVGGWDAGYDLWTNDFTNETMIWNQWAGGNAYWFNQAVAGGITASLGGVTYDFYANCNGAATAANQTNCEYMFFQPTQSTSGSVNILAAWQWEVAHGYAQASSVPTQIQYGVEISYTTGTEDFAVNGLTVAAS